jgi:hypothetical protein
MPTRTTRKQSLEPVELRSRLKIGIKIEGNFSSAVEKEIALFDFVYKLHMQRS